MILKNLFRRKGRTLLTLFGISIGVAAIIALGAMAAGMREGYSAMATGSEADLVLTQESAMDVTMGGLDESVGDQLLGWPEVDEVDGAPCILPPYLHEDWRKKRKSYKYGEHRHKQNQPVGAGVDMIGRP